MIKFPPAFVRGSTWRRAALVLAAAGAAVSGSDGFPRAEGTAMAPHALMPVPQSIEWRDGRLRLAGTFDVAVSGPADPRLGAAIERATRLLGRRLGLALSRELSKDVEAAALRVEVRTAAKAWPGLGDDESYELEVGPRQAVLRAATGLGALRGLETMLQLVTGDAEGWFLPAVRITDRPRFPWRGLLIDVCRHWIPGDVVKRNIDAMAAVKLNVLHLHLTEDQGFRIESRRYPKLHQLGSDGLYYTQDQMRDLIAYAADRGIRVVPEFDVPGHATSWLVGHPELGSAPGPYGIERSWGIFDPTIDPTREDVYRFFDTFLGEMAALFPDAYMHIGGDENNGRHWDANAAIQAFKTKRGIADNHALQAYFNQRINAILQKHGKRMVGWDEILHPDLPRDIVVQSWRGQKSLADGARQGYSGILSNGYYIDLMESTARHYLNDPLPPDLDLAPEAAARVLGGEATMWSEFVDPVTIDSRIWPRLAAIAERLWSPREVTDVDDMHRRLARVSVQLEELGIAHERNPAMLTRQLAAGGDAAALRVLVDLVEPVEGYRRSQEYAKAYGARPTQATPLTRLVDASRADSAEGRRVAALVDGLLGDAPAFERGRAELSGIFERWLAASVALGPLTAQAPALHEARPLVGKLRSLALIGQAALAWLRPAEAPGATWSDEALAALAAAAEPNAEVEFPVIDPIRRLVVAASLVGEVRTTLPAAWKQLVIERASAKTESQ